MATREELRSFLRRPWDRLRASKDRAVAEHIERGGTDAAFALAAMLGEHADAMDARPSRADRDEDLAAAVRLKRLLDRASASRLRRSR